ncbi:sulfatase-like hydrolase/transferase [Halomontanus rarus]|uniref:sulfatase-like hydrolase/transferase n=1 Tax=Halomontanus rarus TaxID=3034020 RepID=UPI001A98FC68
MAESSASDSGASHETVRNVALIVLDTARATNIGGRGVARDQRSSASDSDSVSNVDSGQESVSNAAFESIDDRTMPTLASIADEGTAFERAFATAPWTLPSHASMFTGTYPSEHGAHGGHTYLTDTLRTLPEAFTDAGYETVGVSNNTWITDEFGFDRGFDTLRRGWQYVQSDVDMGTVIRAEYLGGKIRAARDRLFEGNPLVNTANILYSELFQPTHDDGAERTTEWVGDWLRNREDDRPFFLFCNYIEPHVEYKPAREYAEPFLPEGGSYEEALEIRQDPRAYDVGDYEITDREFDLLRALYRGEQAYVDDHIATLRSHFEAAGEWDDTLVVICGDHGEHVGEHDFFGHQYNLYDTLLHVPLVCHGGPFTDGGRREDLVQLLDLPATLCEAAGIEDPELETQGRSRSFHPETDDRPREAVFAEYVAPQPSIERLEARFGEGELPERVYEFDRKLRTIRTPEEKYVVGDDGFERLHDVTSDPLEKLDLSEESVERTEALGQRLEAHFEGIADDAETGSVEMRDSTKDRLADLGYL